MGILVANSGEVGAIAGAGFAAGQTDARRRAEEEMRRELARREAAAADFQRRRQLLRESRRPPRTDIPRPYENGHGVNPLASQTQYDFGNVIRPRGQARPAMAAPRNAPAREPAELPSFGAPDAFAPRPGYRDWFRKARDEGLAWNNPQTVQNAWNAYKGQYARDAAAAGEAARARAMLNPDDDHEKEMLSLRQDHEKAMADLNQGYRHTAAEQARAWRLARATHVVSMTGNRVVNMNIEDTTQGAALVDGFGANDDGFTGDANNAFIAFAGTRIVTFLSRMDTVAPGLRGKRLARAPHQGAGRNWTFSRRKYSSADPSRGAPR